MASRGDKKAKVKHSFIGKLKRLCYRALREMTEQKRHTKGNVKRLEAQTTFIRATNGLLVAVILIVGALILCLSYLPQKIAYEKKQGELVEARQREEQAESQLDYLRVKLEAIKHDPTYLEIQARDRLQVYRPGETIFRIER